MTSAKAIPIGRIDIKSGGTDCLGNTFLAEYSPDGRYILTGSGHGRRCSRPDNDTDTGKARLWYANSGKSASPWIYHVGGVTCIAFNPHGTRFATAGNDRRVLIHQTETGRLVHEAICPSLVAVCCFDASGERLFIVGHNGSISVIEGTSFKRLSSIVKGHPTAVELSPNGQFLGVISGLKVAVVSVETGKQEAVFMHRLRVSCMTWRDNVRLITGCDDSHIREWNIQGGTCRELYAVPRWIWSLAISRDGQKLLLGTEDCFPQSGARGHACVIDLGKKKSVSKRVFHNGTVLSQFFPGETRIATGSADRHVAVWDIADGHLAFRWDFGTMVFCLRVSPTGKQVLAAGGSRVSLFSIPSDC